MVPDRWAPASGPCTGSVALGALLLALALSACEPQPTLHQRSITMFGTLAEVQVLDSDPARATQALDAIEALFSGFDRDWRMFGTGELGRANAALGAGSGVELSPTLARLVRRALEMQSLSDGLFEPRIGALVELWGFQDLAHAVPQTEPDAATVAELRRRTVVSATLHLEGRTLRSSAPLTLDLNGIAEGAALRAGAELLAGHGITSALIDTGGDLLALGRRGDRPWRIGVRDPRRPGILGSVDLEPGETVASSGRYERGFGPDDQRHHILDPGTGHPSRGGRGTTVIALDPELADAAATTLMVAGPGRFHEIAARMGIDCALLATEDGELMMTAKMAQRLHSLPDPAAPGQSTRGS